MKRLCFFLVLALLSWLLAACAAVPPATSWPGLTTADRTLSPSPAATSSSSQTVSPGTSPAVSPDPTPEASTTASLAKPSPTAAPSPTAVPSPSAKPTVRPTTTASGLVRLAEGFYYMKLDSAVKARIVGSSYPADDPDCKISLNDLRYIRLLHYDFAGVVREGELIVNVRVAGDVMKIFYQLYQAKYPLKSVRLVDDFGDPPSDELSMEANNTSAFFYRVVAGTTNLSRHSYGAAIDINPMLNPFVDGSHVSPENGLPYADRTKEFAGKIDHDDLAYKLFKAKGWEWGGDWRSYKDYQHFSINLGY